MERAEAFPALAGALERYDRPHEVHEIHARSDLVQDLGGHSHRLALRPDHARAARLGAAPVGLGALERHDRGARPAGRRLGEAEARDQGMSARHPSTARRRAPVPFPWIRPAARGGQPTPHRRGTSRRPRAPRLSEPEEMDAARGTSSRTGSDTDGRGALGPAPRRGLDLAAGDLHREMAGLHGDRPAVGLRHDVRPRMPEAAELDLAGSRRRRLGARRRRAGRLKRRLGARASRPVRGSCASRRRRWPRRSSAIELLADSPPGIARRRLSASLRRAPELARLGAGGLGLGVGPRPRRLGLAARQRAAPRPHAFPPPAWRGGSRADASRRRAPRARDDLGGEAEALADRQGVARSGVTVLEPESRLEPLGVERDGGVLERGSTWANTLSGSRCVVTMHRARRGRGAPREARRERRALGRVGARAELVEEHERPAATSRGRAPGGRTTRRSRDPGRGSARPRSPPALGP